MRCPRCSSLVTPDLVTCPACGAKLGEQAAGTAQGGSLLDRYRTQIEHDQASWRSQTFGSAAASGTPGPDLGKPGGDLRLDIPSLERTAASEVTLEVDALEFVNFLLLHAGFSPFRVLKVGSSSADGLAGARLCVGLSPELAQKVSVPLADLGKGGELEPPVLSPDYERFLALDEAVRGQLDVEVLYEDTPLASRTLPVTVQTPNEWINMPGVEAALAGVVTPNAPAVSDLVGDLHGDFVAYQDGNRERIVREIAEVYEGIRRLGLQYVGVPPSFEGTGQKVLYPDEVIGGKRGCCIDIATLTAAILERVGYNPLLVMVSGHAYSGVWTGEIRAKRPIIREADVVKQAVAEGDLLVWNSTTYFDRQGDDSIGAAIEIGTRMLEELQYVLDIAACRQHGFKPVPRRSA